MKHAHRHHALTAFVAAVAAFRAWWMGPMWLDNAFLSFCYSDRIARTGSVLLAGQTEPHEAFHNPLWVGIFAVLGRFNVSEVHAQLPLGMTLYAVLAVLLFRTLSVRFSPLVTLTVMLLLGLAPIAAAARDGSDVMLLAVLTLWATLRISREQNRSHPFTVLLVALLVVSGVHGWWVAAGLACFAARKRIWVHVGVVVVCSLVLTALRLWWFGSWFPPLLPGPIVGWAAFQWLPATVATAIVGALIVCVRNRAPTPAVWVLLVGLVLAGLLGHETDGFGVAMIPVVGVLLLLCAELLARCSSVASVIVCGVLLIGVDGVRAERAVDGVRHVRLTHFHQGRGMGRFLLWRFAENDQIVVHRAGTVGYFSRRGMIDLSGALHGRAFTPTEALSKDPVAVLPHRSIVSRKAQRIEMGTAWPDRLENRYKQYAIQHQKQWKMVDMHPVWFHLYIRKDLPMLRPEIPASNGNIMPREDPFGSKE